jgi:DNA-binding transcriptional MerR regulator
MSTGSGREGGGRFQQEPLIKKAYYSIGDVSELTGLKPHVLRYWETQFPELAPTKNRAGNRVYRPREVELVLLVKHLLYKERFTIEGARKKLKELRQAGEMEEERREALTPELLAVFAEELQELLQILEPPPPPADD